MVLSWIWVGLFLIAFATGLYRFVFGSTAADLDVFSAMVNGTFETAKEAFGLSIGLTGVITLWLGLMKVGERGGVVEILGRLVRPFFCRLFPEVPRGHPAHGSIMMNFAANMLGLDNAATPLGLKAMQELQELNPQKDTASNAQIMFLVLNTSGLTLIPVAIMNYRAQAGAANPADVFLPILLTTFFTTITSLIVTAWVQRIRLRDPVLLAWLLGLTGAVVALIAGFTSLPPDQIGPISSRVANITLFTVIVAFIGLAVVRRINVYETFIEGAKEGFNVAVRIIPYLVAILVAVGVFRSSGAMGLLMGGTRWVFATLGMDTEFVGALPTALMKPLSGGASRGLMIDTMTTYGPDSFVARLAGVFQGATDTTFYILAVYFGSVSIKKTRHAVPCGLAADVAAIAAGIPIAYLFFASGAGQGPR